jgi:hypothetical protein
MGGSALTSAALGLGRAAVLVTVAACGVETSQPTGWVPNTEEFDACPSLPRAGNLESDPK